jgi:hypothetical protein
MVWKYDHCLQLLKDPMCQPGLANSFILWLSCVRPGWRGPHSDSLITGQYGIRTPVKSRDFLFSIPFQTGPGAQPASTTIGTGASSGEGGGGEAAGA